MKYKIDKERLWSSPDRKEWVMCAFSGPDENLSEQNTDCIELKVSNGVLNALGQVVYYQQGNEQKLMVNRNGEIEVAAYHHSSRLGHSCHSCVDVVHIKGLAEHVRDVYNKLKDTSHVEKVSFISAPMRDDDCC